MKTTNPAQRTRNLGGTEGVLAPTERTVLIVDDDTEVRCLAGLILEGYEFTVLEARNGLEALETLQRHPSVNAVLLDVMMPVMDGVQACAEIRKRWPKVEVIAMSGLDAKEVVRRFGDVRPHGFLAKPFTIEALVNALSGEGNRCPGSTSRASLASCAT